MGTLLPNAVQTFTGPNGTPLSGGSVYFYIPGTTTPKNTYQDPAQTILNTNPVVLNANGQAIIWGSGVYRQQVYDANNNLIWDQITEDTSGGLLGNMTDNAYLAGSGFTPGTTTQLTLSTGPGSPSNTWVYFDGVYQTPDTYTISGTTITFNAAIPVGVQEVNIKVGNTVAMGVPASGSVVDASVANNAAIQSSKLAYNQGGAGAVTRTVQTRLQDIVSVKDFGAKGDGTTDDTAAIQAAMNWLGINGGELYVPPGTYIVNPAGTAVLTWSTATPFRMRGAGAGASLLQTNSTANASIFNITAGTIELSDIGLYGPTIAAAGGTLLTTVVDHKFVRVDFCRYFNGASLGANIGLLDGCHFGTEFINGPISTSSNGVKVNGYNGGLNFTNCIAYVPENPTLTPFAGINIVSAGGVQMNGCNIIRQGTNVLVNPQSGQTVTSLQIVNCYLDSAQNFNLQIAPSTGGQVLRTYLTQTECSSASQSGIQIDGTNGSIDGVLITAAQANFCAANGITVTGANAKNIDIRGGSLCGNTAGSGLAVANGASVTAVGVRAGAGYGGGGNLIGIFCDSSSTIFARDCDLSFNTSSGASVFASATMLNNYGFTTANTGSSVIGSGGTSVVVNHGLNGTPSASQIQISPQDGWGSNPPFVNTGSINSTSFTVQCASAAGGNINFGWRATCNGQQ